LGVYRGPTVDLDLLDLSAIFSSVSGFFSRTNRGLSSITLAVFASDRIAAVSSRRRIRLACASFSAVTTWFRVRREGDVYTILRYLALVFPQSGKPPEPRADESSFQIVLSASPDGFRGLGWAPAHVLGPAAFDPLGLRAGR